MSQSLRKLCCSLVRDLYGDFYSLIYKHLTEQGRLTAQQLAQRSRLPLRQVQSGLAALIDLHLVLHHASEDALATYSANLENAYDLLRVGKLVQCVKEVHGPFAATIISTACDLRFFTIAELQAQLQQNGVQLADDTVPEDSSRIVYRLLKDKFLVHVRQAHFQPPHDIRREVETLNGAANGLAKVTGSKAKLELEARIVEGIHQRITTARSETGYFDPSTQRPNGAASVNGNSAINCEVLDGRILIKPNFRSVATFARIRCARDEAQKKLGDHASAVLECAVAQIVHRTSAEVAGSTEQMLDLKSLHDGVSHTIHGHSHRLANGIKTNGSAIPAHDDNIQEQRQLSLLSEGPFTFLHMGFDSNWYLDLGLFNNFVQKLEVMRVMTSRLDDTSTRILRILVAKGKLEEKTLQEMGLLSAKELRQSIAQLQQMGYVELQEVPREASRQPNRTLYLWFHDADRVRQLVLDSIYTAISNLLQLLDLERAHVADTLSKVEREDVKGREAEVLAPAELDLLKRFRKLEMWLVTEISRLDDTVAILQ